MRPRFYRNEEIEQAAAARLKQLEQLLGHPLRLPVPIERLAEHVMGLDFLWDEISEEPGERILGALRVKRNERLIVLNEKHRCLFESNPGLERFTIGHEIGTWDLFIENCSPNQLDIFAEAQNSAIVRRRSGIGEVYAIGGQGMVDQLMATPQGRAHLAKIREREDNPHEKRSVNRYSAASLMPKNHVIEEVLKCDRTNWLDLYRMRERFDVTISALRVRLEQLNLIYVDRDGQIHESRDQANGQREFGF
jgi:hypothetical protein